MARPKDDSKIDTIYEATLKLVLKTGFNGLKMADVAKAAKLATGTLYIYFKNKDELVNNLFLYLKTAKTKKVLEVYNPEDPFEVAFKKLWYNYLEISLAEPERMFFIEQFAHTTYLTKKTKAHGDELLKPLAAFLQQGINQKIVRRLPVDMLLSQLMGPIYEIIKQVSDGAITLTPAHKKGLYEMAWNSVKQ
jgi:TetR/AcrR family transcriptional regulator, repressor of fatR-cypB operon